MEALQNLKNRIMTMIGRCILAATKDDGDFQIVQLKGFGDANEMAQLLAQLMQFSDNLEGIKNVLQQGFLKKD
mgnify:CR=1 FL=1